MKWNWKDVVCLKLNRIRNQLMFDATIFWGQLIFDDLRYAGKCNFENATKFLPMNKWSYWATICRSTIVWFFGVLRCWLAACLLGCLKWWRLRWKKWKEKQRRFAKSFFSKLAKAACRQPPAIFLVQNLNLCKKIIEILKRSN